MLCMSGPPGHALTEASPRECGLEVKIRPLPSWSEVQAPRSFSIFRAELAC